MLECLSVCTSWQGLKLVFKEKIVTVIYINVSVFLGFAQGDPLVALPRCMIIAEPRTYGRSSHTCPDQVLAC